MRPWPEEMSRHSRPVDFPGRSLAGLRRDTRRRFQGSRQSRRAPGLGADKGSDLIRMTVDLVETSSGEVPDDQGRCEGVAGTDGVTYRDGQPRMIGPGAVGQ